MTPDLATFLAKKNQIDYQFFFAGRGSHCLAFAMVNDISFSICNY